MAATCHLYIKKCCVFSRPKSPTYFAENFVVFFGVSAVIDMHVNAYEMIKCT